ncbi:nucleotidyltransferase family protein [Nocardioides sp.]|uniref:nucleotidyltransferase family protein n=1 Tax=Nocardioides sp. TaxID=35761 RepID=UPI0039E6C5D2
MPTGVVLAAGRGTRMGGPKAELVVDGERLMDRAVRLLAAAGCEPVCVIGRPEFSYPEVLVWWPDDLEAGLRTTLETALTLAVPAVTTTDDDPVAVMLVDQPGLTADGTRSVVAAWRPGRIAIGVIGGQRVHPVVMAARLWREAIAMAGPDEGARRFLATHPELVDEVEVPGDPADLDTPEDVARWSADRAQPPGPTQQV